MQEKKKQFQDKITPELISRHLSDNCLDLSIRHFTSIENLSDLKNLKTLNLGFNNITSISGLNNLVELQKLYLEHNLINQIKGLEKNKNLRVLNLMNNKIQKIEGLNGLIRLEEINLSNNRITKLAGIQTQKLISLNLNNNLIQSLDFLPVAPKLQELLISNNKISYISQKVFNNCQKMLRLDLSKNQIKSMKFVEYLPGLQQLNVGFNSIQSLDVGCEFEYLEILYLNDNKIFELPYLSNIFPELMTFDISNNCLSSEVTLIQAITGLESLINLNFVGNPICTPGCQQKYSKIFKLEVINEKQILDAGEKYASQINDIVQQWKQFPQLYLYDKGLEQEDLSDINAIKKDGFFNQDLEKLLIGEVSRRPTSPTTKYPANEQRAKHMQQMHNQIEETSERIKYLQLTYREMMKKNNIPISKSECLIPSIEQSKIQNSSDATKEFITNPTIIQNVTTPTEKGRSKNKLLSSTLTVNQMNKMSEAFKVERQASIDRWKQIKNKDIRGIQMKDSRKNSEVSAQIVGNDAGRQKPNLSLPKIVTRSDKSATKFNKTQSNTSNAFQGIPSQKMNLSYRRPPSGKRL